MFRTSVLLNANSSRSSALGMGLSSECGIYGWAVCTIQKKSHCCVKLKKLHVCFSEERSQTDVSFPSEDTREIPYRSALCLVGELWGQHVPKTFEMTSTLTLMRTITFSD